MEIINNWTEDNRRDYGKKVMAVEHSLQETGLFSDQALADLLDKHPKHLIDVLAIPNDGQRQQYKHQHLTVDFGDASGATLVAAAQSGDIWINIREAMNTHHEYIELLDQLHDELEQGTGRNFDRRNCRGGILVSSPTARTPYHSDPTITHLWHIRGHKRVWVYPLGQEFLPDEAFEAIILGERNEDVPYHPEMDTKAGVYDLHGGEMVSWPHRSPHRVENQSFCVSMVMEFSTHESAFINGGMVTNGILRRKFGMQPQWDNASQFEKIIKSVAGRILRKAGALNSYRYEDMVQFKLDETVSGYLRQVEPYKRAF